MIIKFIAKASKRLTRAILVITVIAFAGIVKADSASDVAAIKTLLQEFSDQFFSTWADWDCSVAIGDSFDGYLSSISTETSRSRVYLGNYFPSFSTYLQSLYNNFDIPLSDVKGEINSDYSDLKNLLSTFFSAADDNLQGINSNTANCHSDLTAILQYLNDHASDSSDIKTSLDNLPQALNTGAILDVLNEIKSKLTLGIDANIDFSGFDYSKIPNHDYTSVLSSIDSHQYSIDSKLSKNFSNQHEIKRWTSVPNDSWSDDNIVNNVSTINATDSVQAMLELLKQNLDDNSYIQDSLIQIAKFLAPTNTQDLSSDKRDIDSIISDFGSYSFDGENTLTMSNVNVTQPTALNGITSAELPNQITFNFPVFRGNGYQTVTVDTSSLTTFFTSCRAIVGFAFWGIFVAIILLGVRYTVRAWNLIVNVVSSAN